MGDARERLGLRVRELRLERNLTQEQLAERAGLSYKFIGQVERGTGNASIDTVERLAAALGVEMAELFGARPVSYVRPGRDVMLVREVVRSLEAAIATLEGKRTRKRSRRKG